MEETAKAPFWKPALTYGAIYGIVGIVLSVIFYVLNLQFKGWTQLVSLVVSILVIVYCLKNYRNEYLGGYASYGKLLVMSLTVAVVATILTTIYTYILINVIDPEYIQKATQFQIDRLSSNPRIPEAQLDRIIERMESRMNNQRTLLMGFAMGIVITFIIGLIASAFIKKEQNPVS